MDPEWSAESIYQYQPQDCASDFNLFPYYQQEWLTESAVARLSFLKNPELANKWQEFKNDLPESEKVEIAFPSIRDLHFKNSFIHYIKPEEISYRKQMKSGPWLDHNRRQLPIPWNIQHRYRNVS